MVAYALILSALAATQAPAASPGAHIEIRVSATIRSGVVLKTADAAAALPNAVPAATRHERPCADAAPAPAQCRMIVYDLP